MLSPFGFAPQNDVIETRAQSRSGIDFLVKQEIGEGQSSF